MTEYNENMRFDWLKKFREMLYNSKMRDIHDLIHQSFPEEEMVSEDDFIQMMYPRGKQ